MEASPRLKGLVPRKRTRKDGCHLPWVLGWLGAPRRRAAGARPTLSADACLRLCTTTATLAEGREAP